MDFFQRTAATTSVPLFVEDYYLLGKQKTLIVPTPTRWSQALKSEKFTAQVRGTPGYDTPRTGEISSDDCLRI
jgi:hypothetical protein